MDVTMPDGTVIQGVPDGVTKAQLSAKYSAHMGGPATASAQPQERGFMGDVAAYGRGIQQSLYDIPQSAIEIGARGTDAVGLSNGAYDMFHKMFSDDQPKGDKYFNGGRVVGDIGVTLPAMGAKIPGLAAKLPRLAPYANGALQGATAAAMTSTASDAPLGSQLALGAAGGAAVPLITKAAGAVISPIINPAAKALMDRGIPLTPGQIAGGGLRDFENKLTSVPILGDLIKNGQRNSVTGLNRAAYNDALAPIGQSVPKGVQAGREGVDYVAKEIGKRYDAILPQMTGALDQQLIQDVNAAASTLKAEGVTNETIDRFKNVVEAQLIQRANGGAYAGDTLKGIQGDLNRIASHHSSSADSSDRALGQALSDVHLSFNDMLMRTNPNFAQPLKEANTAWAQYARIRRAASSVGSKDGVFSPAQYANAVKASDKSVGKGAYARGKALQQDLSDPANQIIPGTIPDSGTPGRLMAALALGGLPTINAPAGIAAGLGSALYTAPGQKLMSAVLTKRPAGAPAARAALSKYGALGAPALGSLIGGSGN